MANFYILSNNPMVREKYPELVKFEETGVDGIYSIARDAIHMNSVLINHPLAGSVKPNESPFRSLVLSNPKQNLDTMSLQLIEGAFAVLAKMPIKQRDYSPQTIEDFMVIDLDLLDSAVKALPAEYHR